MHKIENAEFPKQTALIVHPDLGVLSAFQDGLSNKGFQPVIARDLPTALLAMTHYHFSLVIIGGRLTEESDGLALAGVVRMCYPDSYVAVIGPSPNILLLQAAINNGVTKLYERGGNEMNTLGEILGDIESTKGTVDSRVH